MDQVSKGRTQITIDILRCVYCEYSSGGVLRNLSLPFSMSIQVLAALGSTLKKELIDSDGFYAGLLALNHSVFSWLCSKVSRAGSLKCT